MVATIIEYNKDINSTKGAPIRRLLLHEEIAQRLRWLIFSGELIPGARVQ